MARPKKARIALNIKPEAEIMEQFISYCEEVGQTKTMAFERIVAAYLEEYNADKAVIDKLKKQQADM